MSFITDLKPGSRYTALFWLKSFQMYATVGIIASVQKYREVFCSP